MSFPSNLSIKTYELVSLALISIVSVDTNFSCVRNLLGARFDPQKSDAQNLLDVMQIQLSDQYLFVQCMYLHVITLYHIATFTPQNPNAYMQLYKLFEAQYKLMYKAPQQT